MTHSSKTTKSRQYDLQVFELIENSWHINSEDAMFSKENEANRK